MITTNDPTMLSYKFYLRLPLETFQMNRTPSFNLSRLLSIARMLETMPSRTIISSQPSNSTVVASIFVPTIILNWSFSTLTVPRSGIVS